MRVSREIGDAHRLLVQSIVAQNGGNTVLPLLQTIEWRTQTDPIDDTLIPFCASMLRSITIDSLGLKQAEHISLFRRLHESSPFLEEIFLFTTDTVDGPSVVKELVCFSRFQRIQISRISDPEAEFLALATMPHLMSLWVFKVAGTWARAGHAISFRNLRALSVMGDASVLAGLFTRVRFPALETALVDVTDYRAQAALEDTAAVISSFSNAISAGSLSVLQLRIQMQAQTSQRARSLPALRDLVSPILPLYFLRSFTLCALTGPVATLDDADVDALARAWPSLESLDITSGPSPESCLSFNALYCIHMHCRLLQELSIPRLRWPIIGVHRLPAPFQVDSSGSELPVSAAGKPHALRRLDVVKEYLPQTMSAASLGPELSDEGAEAMARYLLDLFPGLEGEQYKGAAQSTDDLASNPTQTKKKLMRGFDGRWRKVSGWVHALCFPRDAGL